VSSIINGVISEFDANGAFLRVVLQPPAGEVFGPQPYSTGTPLGLTVGPDGTLYYADLGLRAGPNGPVRARASGPCAASPSSTARPNHRRRSPPV
jgi:hypothetical protein